MYFSTVRFTWWAIRSFFRIPNVTHSPSQVGTCQKNVPGRFWSLHWLFFAIFGPDIAFLMLFWQGEVSKTLPERRVTRIYHFPSECEPASSLEGSVATISAVIVTKSAQMQLFCAICWDIATRLADQVTTDKAKHCFWNFRSYSFRKYQKIFGHSPELGAVSSRNRKDLKQSVNIGDYADNAL